jgi:hypothetical protein
MAPEIKPADICLLAITHIVTALLGKLLSSLKDIRCISHDDIRVSCRQMTIQPEKALFSVKAPKCLRLVRNPGEKLLKKTE